MLKKYFKNYLLKILTNHKSSQKPPGWFHSKIMQFDWFLSVLEQKRLKNHEIYHLEAAEKPLRFPHCAPLLGWRYLYIYLITSITSTNLPYEEHWLWHHNLSLGVHHCKDYFCKSLLGQLISSLAQLCHYWSLR